MDGAHSNPGLFSYHSIRRVKCDEAKPSCRRCVQTGRKCDGYAAAAVAGSSSAAHAALGKQKHPAALPLSIASYSIPFRMPGSQRDRQLIHYFCVRAGGEMSGYLGAETGSFWSRTVLHDYHAEPVVRQALVALSSLHLGYCVDDIGDGTVQSPGKTHNEEALRQYGKALGALQRRLGAAGSGDGVQRLERTAMVCCVLFYCFESALGDSAGAIRHLDNGLRVLTSKREGGRGRGMAGRGIELEDGEDSIAEVLARLDLQATMFDDARPPALELVSAEERDAGIAELRDGDGSAKEDDVKHSFLTAAAAQSALSRLQNWLLRFLGENVGLKECSLDHIPPSVLEERAKLARDYVRWRTMLDGLIEGRGLVPGGEDRGVKMLGVHHRLMQLLLESSLPADAAVFGAETNMEARALLDTIEDVIRSGSDKDVGAAARRSFSSETGVVAPLFILTIKCADEAVTTRAAGLLAACRRREGLYDAGVMAEVLRKLGAVRDVKMQALELCGDGLLGEVGEGEGLGGDTRRQVVSLEVWGEDMIESRGGGFDAIGDASVV